MQRRPRLDAGCSTAILPVMTDAQRIRRLKAKLKQLIARREAIESEVAAQQDCLKKLLAVDRKQWAERVKSGKN